MTEAEILQTRNDLTTILVSVVSVSFAMISAYIVALWAFLKTAPLTLRIVAFSLLSCGLAFLGGVALGVHHLLEGTERAWRKLESNSVGLGGFGDFRPSWGLGLSLYEMSAAAGAAAFGLIYLALMALTFFYHWRDA